LYHIQTTEITPEIITNIAETVFKEFEKVLTEEENIELLNPTKNLYSNEQDLYLYISTFIDLKSLVFTTSKNSYENEEINEI
ncbi:13774_t:CDS:1, partial [Racocetra fulgida]